MRIGDARSCASDRWNRRRFLASAGMALGAVATAGCRIPAGSRLRRSFAADPFGLGVASGSPVADGIVLWTRLAPAPLDPDGGLPPEPIEVFWQLAADDQLRRIVRQGTARALPELAHSVHVELRGLEPGRNYWYRFVCGEAESPIGRTRTALEAGSRMSKLRLAYASCQHYEQGYFNAYAAMLEDDLDLVVHLGDYIYEGSSWADEVRKHAHPEPVDLAGYRNYHALYKTDPDLRAAHAAYPWAVTWDDHEVDNDYASAYSQDRDDPASFLARRAAAYQAYYEHMPLWGRSLPVGPDLQLYQRLGFGDLVELNILDGRQYRADHACGETGRGGGQVVSDCAVRLSPAQSLLGVEQRNWLLGGLARSTARWNVLAQQLLMAQLDQVNGSGEGYWTDGWDGYAGERALILKAVADRRIPNVVVIGGDIHSFWAADLKPDFRDAAAPAVASEFVGTSITSQGVPYERFASMLPENPHIKFFDSRQRGYVRCEVTPEVWKTDFRVVESVRTRNTSCRTLASFAVEVGRPGVVPA